MKPSVELRHLLSGAKPEDEVEGAGIILFNVYCKENATQVLLNCREVLAIVLQQYENPWPSETEWHRLLPTWFIEKCASEQTLEEVENDAARWQKLSREEQRREEEEEAWSVMDWIRWFESTENPFEQRFWFWWDSFIKDPNLLLVAVEVVDVPFPWGALNWLLRASGALKVEESNL